MVLITVKISQRNVYIVQTLFYHHTSDGTCSVPSWWEWHGINLCHFQICFAGNQSFCLLFSTDFSAMHVSFFLAERKIWQQNPQFWSSKYSSKWSYFVMKMRFSYVTSVLRCSVDEYICQLYDIWWCKVLNKFVISGDKTAILATLIICVKYWLWEHCCLRSVCKGCVTCN